MSNSISSLLEFLNRLDDGNIHYSLAHNRDEAIMVLISVPGERWEVEFLQDGSVEVEIFSSDGRILDGRMLEDLIAKHSDKQRS